MTEFPLKFQGCDPSKKLADQLTRLDTNLQSELDDTSYERDYKIEIESVDKYKESLNITLDRHNEYHSGKIPIRVFKVLEDFGIKIKMPLDYIESEKTASQRSERINVGFKESL